MNFTFKQKLQKGLAKPVRNRSYLNWVKVQVCPCGNPADDPSHVNTGGYKGMGTKAPDIFVWPSCRYCHNLYEHDVDEWRARFGNEWEWVALTLAQAVDEGVITL